MKRFSFRVTALVAISAAISMASMLASAPRFENGRDLDSVIRKTRSGPQRDAGDAVDHHFEVADPVIVGIGDTFSTLDRHSRVHAPPGAAMLPDGPAASPGPETLSSLLLVPPVSSTLLARPQTPSRGRAPPTS
jgi:hypothetical protein